jgi:hypothetical protein
MEKEIELTSSATTPKLVVQGVVQPGYPAYVMLTQSEAYFSSVSTDFYVTDAEVKISDVNGVERSLINIADVPRYGIPEIDSMLYMLEEQMPGFYLEWIDEFVNPFVLFTPPYNTLADFGGRYDLSIVWQGDTITSTTTIPEDYIVDSVWFQLDELAPRDSLGNFWFHYNDPDTMGNTLMFEAKRLAHIKEWVNPDNGNVAVSSIADPLMVKSLWGYVRNDFEGLNGTAFNSFFQRGEMSTLVSSDYNDIVYEAGERGYFKSGQSVPTHDKAVHPDTVLVKISQIDNAAYLFWRSIDYQAQSTGNPFAEPSNLQTNINGGYGVWFGQAPLYLKAVAKEGVVYKKEDRHYPFVIEIL